MCSPWLIALVVWLLVSFPLALFLGWYIRGGQPPEDPGYIEWKVAQQNKAAASLTREERDAFLNGVWPDEH